MLLHAIIIDDEPLAISAMKNKLQLFPNIQVTHTFTNVNKFLENYSSLNVDIIFLDIEMQGINGLDVAKQLKEIHPFLWIVFEKVGNLSEAQIIYDQYIHYLEKELGTEPTFFM